MSALLVPWRGRAPRVAPDSFVAPTAVLVGDVEVRSGASIWYGAVLRADDCAIAVLEGANVQDGAVIHADAGNDVEIGEEATIGHRAVIHGCRVGAGALVGMNAVALDRAQIGPRALLGANALLTAGRIVPPQRLWTGSPATDRRDLTDEELRHIREGAALYREKTRQHLLAAQAGAEPRPA
ncbi:gamma carbonic anhydrase family protein [Methylobacterium currus]|uniref:Gamma carbonic anhydrase family protein n=1 Tax=Methylobacterium currus TaxID=2051553 RepID=A0A2R4WWE3_9HYPH|nr:gamma carbonic anhydrase family protein [Methylobacterium currus]AWB25862.1 gamma carbonic anhydrase family protein [Methylobacterium currus]UHC19501.1 gamma carbonic anhydrase family protein [Methylobacterium currus]